MTAGIRIFNTFGSALIDDRFKGVALKTTAAVAGDVTVKDAAGRTYVFGTPPVLGAGVGMRVFSSVDHSVVFDSRNKYIRVVDIVTGSLTSSTAFTKTYPAGKTYACGVLGFTVVSTLLQANTTDTATLLPTEFDRPSLSLSGTTLTVSKDTSEVDNFNAPPHTDAGYHFLYRPDWRVVVVDVTGY